MIHDPITKPAVVTPEEWLSASQELLVKEKAFTRARDAMSATRRALPWVKVDTDYVFESEGGPVSLSDLFAGKSQLIIYHFMYAPGWQEGCDGCSFVSDHFDAARQHFEHADVAFAVISRGPLHEFLPYKKRMGWTFPWLSSATNSFNYDFGVSFTREELDRGPVYYNFKLQTLKGEDQPGLTVFAKDAEGVIYRTYSTYERGLDLLVGAYNFLDLVPKGRNEEHGMSWMKRHDTYEA